MAQSLRRSLIRVGRWPRMCAAGICLLLALASALGASRRHATAAAPRTVPVAVAARTLPAGHVLARRDLTVARCSAGLRPAGSTADPARLVGKRLAGPVAARETVTKGRLVGADLTAGLGPATVATPVTLSTDVAAFVHPGDRIDLVATPRSDVFGSTGSPPERPPKGTRDASAGSAELVARRVTVLAVYDVSDGASGAAVTALVLATGRELALRIAGLRTTQMFAAVGDPP